MHAVKRAWQRGVTQDLIENTIMTGKMAKFGKNRIKFIKKLRAREIICVDEIRNNVIFIVSITARRKP